MSTELSKNTEQRDRPFIELRNLDSGELERFEAEGAIIRIPAGHYAVTQVCVHPPALEVKVVGS